MSTPRLAQLRLVPGPSAPARARRFLEETCGRWMAADAGPATAAATAAARAATTAAASTIADAALVLSELVTNAVRHAGTEIQVALELWDGALTVSVHDGGPALPRLIPQAERRFGGQGLAIVVRLAEAWGVVVGDGGKTVWCRLRPRAASAAGAQWALRKGDQDRWSA